MCNLLYDEHVYRKIRYDPGPEINKTAYECISKLTKYKFKGNTTKLKLQNSHFNSPRIRGVIKLHKNDYPFIPIVDN